jgi:D-alanyl-D-alanine carboxypeptidase/D-alanyl-D-alanine carboxypeptidase (penicillin-binding protein 5/6)
MKEPDLVTQIPLSSKLMTALLSVESIQADTMITISSVAAQQKDSAELSLKAGEKYSLKYLLYGLILKDNSAAAIALAEQVSGTQEKFVELMNSKAESYQMNSTVFTNPTGEFDENQKTTVSDVARLFRFAISLSQLEAVLKTRDSVFILNTTTTKHLISDSADIWATTEGATGVFTSSGKSVKSFSVTAKSGQMGIFAIGVSSATSTSDVSDDISTIVSSIFSDYEYSTLAVSGQTFPKTMTYGSETFSLKFNNQINYVHPKSVDFIYTTIYEEASDISAPILITNPVAKVTFVLLDGTRISADLFPSVNIWSESTVFQKVIDIYEDNSDIIHIITFLLTVLVLLAVTQLIRTVVNASKARTSR